MHGYRLYFLSNEGRIIHVVEFEDVADEDAFAAVERLSDGRPMELWSLDRQVAVFAAERSARAG